MLTAGLNNVLFETQTSELLVYLFSADTLLEVSRCQERPLVHWAQMAEQLSPPHGTSQQAYERRTWQLVR